MAALLLAFLILTTGRLLRSVSLARLAIARFLKFLHFTVISCALFSRNLLKFGACFFLLFSLHFNF